MSAVTSPRPRKERTENARKRRRQLLDAARRSIVANGLAKTTLSTVAAEAGLSQGSAVFYYNSKGGLLSAVLEDMYLTYQLFWQKKLTEAGPSQSARLRAIVSADFDESVCNHEMLSVWFAFWGEQEFNPDYAEITDQFESRRRAVIFEACEALAPDGKAAKYAEWIDTLTDGYWHRMYLFPESCTPELALKSTFEMVSLILPDWDKQN